VITPDDDGPGHEADDSFATLLRPEPLYLSPPPGCYEAIHRGAARRRLASAAATVGAAFAVVAAIALLVVVPLHGGAPGDPRPSSPAIPVAPPSGGTSRDAGTPEPSPSTSHRPGDGEETPGRTGDPRRPPTEDLRSPQRQDPRSPSERPLPNAEEESRSPEPTALTDPSPSTPTANSGIISPAMTDP
jgi:hypothetical protein